MPLSDRDYMRRTPPTREYRRTGSSWGLGMSPVLALIIVNLMLFMATLVSPAGRYPFGEYAEVLSDRFTYYLGLIPYYFTSRPWTIVSSMFLHGGFGHILGNMITLYFFGSFLSRLVGNGRFLIVYFIGGIAGNALFLLLGPSLSIAIGASGAVYAIAGVLVVMMPRLPVRLYFIIPMPLWVVVLVFFVLFSLPPIAESLHMAWQAHLGGLAVGLIAGYFFRRRGGYYYMR